MPELYLFREATASDLTMLARWLETPEVVRWWGEPGEQLALLTEDLNVAAMQQWIVSLNGRAFAYAQAYDVHVWPQSHFAQLPPGSRGIDVFIGEPEMIGKGHGAALVRQLAQMLCAQGAPLVVVDPEAANQRARRAYTNAGFRIESLVEGEQGTDVLMVFDASE